MALILLHTILTFFLSTFHLLCAACGGRAAGAQGAADDHASPAGGEAAAAGGAEETVQGEGAGEGHMLPAADTQPGQRQWGQEVILFCWYRYSRYRF